MSHLQHVGLNPCYFRKNDSGIPDALSVKVSTLGKGIYNYAAKPSVLVLGGWHTQHPTMGKGKLNEIFLVQCSRGWKSQTVHPNLSTFSDGLLATSKHVWWHIHGWFMCEREMSHGETGGKEPGWGQACSNQSSLMKPIGPWRNINPFKTLIANYLSKSYINNLESHLSNKLSLLYPLRAPFLQQRWCHLWKTEPSLIKEA